MFDKMWDAGKYMEDMYSKSNTFFQRAMALPKMEQKWATHNRVILKEKTLWLRHFPNPHINARRPVLILPPQAGHHANIADYSAEQSLVRVFHQYNYDVYVTEWLSATPEYKNLGIEDYINLTDLAVEEIRRRTDIYKIHLVGECQGGWQAAIYTSLYPEKIAALVAAACPIDVSAADSEVVQNSKLPMRFFEDLVESNNGLMNGKYILTGFKNMEPQEHYWHKYFQLWKMVFNDDVELMNRYDRFSEWYEYSQMLPGRFFLEAIDKIFKRNGMVNPGTIKINGTSVNLNNIDCPLILVGGEKDHITPPAQVFAMRNHVSTDPQHVVEIMSKGGHIGTLMGVESLRNQWTIINDMLQQV
ncbi:MAG: alpha/beta fold hydrolase [Firmicutes bacterium]|nr:alpha/beta fold hydrolase [Bacillota bacterium]